jgi:ribonucleoside-diphosphate reductase alpha chain
LSTRFIQTKRFSMKISRYFTKDSGPYDGINFVKRTSRINKLDGNALFENSNVIVPDKWSQVATDILAQKYFRRRGLGKDGTEGETDSRQVFERLTDCWKTWGVKYNYFDTAEDADAFKEELQFMLANQMAAPNSPQWFNTGLFNSYGINGPSQGHYYVDPDSKELKASTSSYERPQPHACFIQSVKDDLVNDGGIMDLWTREARLFKYGSGTGTNFSNIRGANEALSGGGKSSGLMSFLGIGDKAAGAIKSGGTTRRAAKMVILNADHPDIETFIDWKVKEERKVVALAAGSQIMRKHWDRMCKAYEASPSKDPNPYTNEKLKKAIAQAYRDGIAKPFISQCLGRLQNGDTSRDIDIYDTNWDGEAYLTVNGMNSNNSVRLTNDFMDSMKAGGDWNLTSRTDGSVVKTIKSKELWDRIVKAAWFCADPGLQFDTTINEWHTCLNSGRINGSNPCSEYMFLDDSACNLASLNLCSFLNDGVFNVEAYRHAVRLWTIVLEISVLMAQYPSPTIAQLSYEFRTLGLGYANLGTMLQRLGIPYDSDQGRQWAGAVTAILTGEAYATSAKLAKDHGPFERYEENKEVMLKVIGNHRSAAYNAKTSDYEDLTMPPVGLKIRSLPRPLGAAVKECWDEAWELGKQYGYRNAQVSCLAPTGTIGLIMDCDTTGIEPDFSIVKFKKLAGGGYFKLVNQSLTESLSRLGYKNDEIEGIVEYVVGIRKITEDTPGINLLDLHEKGFTDEMIQKIEKAIPTAFDPSFLFSLATLSDDDYRALGLNPDGKETQPLLEQLGFTQDAIEKFYLELGGRMTVEGAPGLKTEHYAIFDCANRCGKIGKRFIAPMGHVYMMAATQPFLSGAISKTVNLPAETSMDEIGYIYEEAWKCGLKSIALYRDGSKMSQALATNLDLLDSADILLDDEAPKVEKTKAIAEGYLRSYRRKLPNRRGGYTQSAQIGTTKIYLRTGEYEDGGLGEIFLDTHREGAAFRSLLNAFAISVSMGLQYGVPLEEFCDAFMFTKFEPAGMVRGNDSIKMAHSIIDYVFRELSITYLGRTDLVQNEEGQEITKPVARTIERGLKEGTVERVAMIPVARMGKNDVTSAKEKGYTGDACVECGNLTLVRNGSCTKCMTCGATGGCS